MSEGVSSSLAAVAHLRSALEEMADALAQADLDRLLACEARIENALTSVSNSALTSGSTEALTGVSQPGIDTRQLPDIDRREQVEAARTALVRCERLGLSLDRFIAACTAARGTDGLYGPLGSLGAGQHDATVAGPHALNCTV